MSRGPRAAQGQFYQRCRDGVSVHCPWVFHSCVTTVPATKAHADRCSLPLLSLTYAPDDLMSYYFPMRDRLTLRAGEQPAKATHSGNANKDLTGGPSAPARQPCLSPFSRGSPSVSELPTTGLSHPSRLAGTLSEMPRPAA